MPIIDAIERRCVMANVEELLREVLTKQAVQGEKIDNIEKRLDDIKSQQHLVRRAYYSFLGGLCLVVVGGILRLAGIV